MHKIKILRIIARLNIGGPAIHTILLTEGLNRDKFETHFVVGSLGKDEGDMSYFADKMSVDVKVIPELCQKINLINDFVALFKILKILRKEKFDIIHTHTAKAGTLGRFAGIIYNLTHKNKCLLIHTFHGHVLHGYFGKLKSFIFLLVEKFLALKTDKIVALSVGLKNELVALKVAGKDKITIIPLGIDLNKFLPLRIGSNIDNQIKNMGIIGRLVPIKNHRMFLESAKILFDDLKYNDVNFYIIGDGELRADLEQIAKDLSIEGKVIFTGWKKDLTEIYSQLDLVCLTSLNEGTPVSLIEAMASGVPVVATDVGGVGDLIRPVCAKASIDSSMILIESKNSNKFAKGIEYLLLNKDVYLKLAHEGREFVKNAFSKERLIKDIELLYNTILNQRRLI